MKCLKETGKGPPGDGPNLLKMLEENYFGVIKYTRLESLSLYNTACQEPSLTENISKPFLVLDAFFLLHEQKIYV